MIPVPESLRTPQLTPRAFTEIYADVLRQERPEKKVYVTEALQIALEVDGKDHICHLDHVWHASCKDPGIKDIG